MRCARGLAWIAAVVAVGFVAPSVAWADYATIRGVPVTQGQMRVAEDDFEKIKRDKPGAVDQFVLKETRVDAEISGVLARVRVEHVFQNPYPERLEAIYVFPLPEDAAVDRYWFQVGEQVVRGVVKKREEARYEYEKARDEGRKAALLEQERPDIFTQSVANIPPGGTITVHVEYVHPLKIDHDRYTFFFPMVVGPRYIPGQAQGGPNVGRGWAPDTDQVPDASRITPATLPPGMRSGNDVHVTVKLDAGMPIHEVTGVTHELDVQKKSETEAVVGLKNKMAVPNKDFVVEYRLAGNEATLATLAHRSQSGGYFTLVLQPKWKTETAELTSREVILLLDTSGSMAGTGISQLRVFAGHVLEGLNPQDTFRVIAFSNKTRAFHGRAVPATPENVAAGQQFVRALQARGGTEMLPALRKALGSGSAESGQVRYLVLVTDALVGNDNSILGYLKQPEFGDVRVFPVAMGAAPNHYLISRAAEVARGFALQVTNQDNAAEMARRFNEKVSAPYMTDLQIDWGGLAVEDVIPGPLPDLYAGRPLVVMGRYDKPGKAQITLKGNIQGQAVQTALELDLPEKEPTHDCLGSLWARQRIRQIWNRDLGNQTPKGQAEITKLGLTHQLVTRYTSFVAVEVQPPEQLTGNLRTEDVPAMLGEGMTEAALGQTAAKPSPNTAPAARNAPAPAVSPAPRPAPDQYASAPPAAPYTPPNTAPAPGGPPPARPSGGFGGGSVEWLFLLSLGALGGGRLVGALRRRRRGKLSQP